jgi:hypothetical protein
MAAAPESLQPFKGVSGVLLQQVGADQRCIRLQGGCTRRHLEAMSLAEAFDAGILPSLQHIMPQKLADRRLDTLLSKSEAMTQHADTKVVAQQHLGRVLSLEHSVATAWFNIL